MDLGFVLLQVATAVPGQIAAGLQGAAPSAAQALDVAKDGGFGAMVSRTLTDILHAAWGADRTKHPPPWVLLVGALVFGVVGVALALMMKGANLLDPQTIAQALGVGLTTSGPLATTSSQFSKNAEPRADVPPPPIGPSPIQLDQTPIVPDQSSAAPLLQDLNPKVDSAPAAPDPRPTIIAVAESRLGMPYQLDPPPDGVNTIDCSSFVIVTYEAAGLPFDPEDLGKPLSQHRVRTAEQIRAACVPISFDQVRPGDMLFFEHTYEPTESAGADGHTASHIGVSYGAGTRRMIDAHGDGVQQTDISSTYWQEHILSAGRHPSLVDPPSQLTTTMSSTALVQAIDVSSHQPQDLAQLISATGARHVVVKLYQPVEKIGDRETGGYWSAAQIASAKENGASCGGYIWLYGGMDPAAAVRNVLSLASDAGLALPILWLDLETYRDAAGSLTYPLVEEVQQAVAECQRQGVAVGIYTGGWFHQSYMDKTQAFAGLPLWVANYDGNPTLEVSGFGGMVVKAHQYSDRGPDGSGLDMDVFLPEMCGV